jgi:putative FmdB family regulatory protein
MPLYEYECESCMKRFERIQKFSDPLVDTCPSCGGVVRKLLSSPAIQFKGSGWYINDYAKKSSGDSGSKDAKDTKDAKDSKDTPKKDASSSTSESSSASSTTSPSTTTKSD